MSAMETAAKAFFEACETGKGWTACQHFCTPDASFSCQADALAEIIRYNSNGYFIIKYHSLNNVFICPQLVILCALDTGTPQSPASLNIPVPLATYTLISSMPLLQSPRR